MVASSTNPSIITSITPPAPQGGLEFEVCWVVPAELLGDTASPSVRPLPLDLDAEIERYGATTPGGR